MVYTGMNTLRFMDGIKSGLQDVLSAVMEWLRRMRLFILRVSYRRNAFRIQSDAGEEVCSMRDPAFEKKLRECGIGIGVRTLAPDGSGMCRMDVPRFSLLRWLFRFEFKYRAGATAGRTVPRRADVGGLKEGGATGGKGSGKASPAAPRETPSPLSLEQLAAAREEYMATRSVLSKENGQ